jgi:hypothetical protein
MFLSMEPEHNINQPECKPEYRKALIGLAQQNNLSIIIMDKRWLYGAKKPVLKLNPYF